MRNLRTFSIARDSFSYLRKRFFFFFHDSRSVHVLLCPTPVHLRFFFLAILSTGKSKSRCHFSLLVHIKFPISFAKKTSL